jgi:hypothetical protein
MILQELPVFRHLSGLWPYETYLRHPQAAFGIRSGHDEDSRELPTNPAEASLSLTLRMYHRPEMYDTR